MWSTVATYTFVKALPGLHWYFAMVPAELLFVSRHCFYSFILFRPVSESLFRPFRPFHSGYSTFSSLHPLFIHCSPLVPNFNWSCSSFLFSGVFVSAKVCSQSAAEWVKPSCILFFVFYCIFVIVYFCWSVLSLTPDRFIVSYVQDVSQPLA